jgi:hypothetical protein
MNLLAIIGSPRKGIEHRGEEGWASGMTRDLSTLLSVRDPLPCARLICVASLLLLCAGSGFAQDPLELEGEHYHGPLDEWGLALTPYAWFAANSTDVGGRAIRQSFNDIASLTNVGFQCRLLARWRWALFVADWTYADMQAEQEIGPVLTDIGVSQHILDIKVGGNLYDTRTPVQDGGVGIWLGAGARYWDNTIDFTITREPVIPGDPVVDAGRTGQAWWDPALGLTMHFPVKPGVGFLIRATGGGFGIGSASDYMWDAEFAAFFKVSARLMVSAGYRQFKYSRKDGTGEDEVKQTVSVIGPAIGLSIGIL